MACCGSVLSETADFNETADFKSCTACGKARRSRIADEYGASSASQDLTKQDEQKATKVAKTVFRSNDALLAIPNLCFLCCLLLLLVLRRPYVSALYTDARRHASMA